MRPKSLQESPTQLAWVVGGSQCHQCKDIVASGVTEMFKALLDAVQSSQRSLKYEIEATDSSVNGLDDKLYDIRSQISSLDDKINNIRGE